MKGKDLIKIIQDNQLEEFEIKTNHKKPYNGSFWGIEYLNYMIDELVDIEYSDKTATFSIIEL